MYTGLYIIVSRPYRSNPRRNLEMSDAKDSAGTHVGCIALQHRSSLIDRVLPSSPSSPSAPPRQGIQSLLDDSLHCLPGARSSAGGDPRSSPNPPSPPSSGHSSSHCHPSVFGDLMRNLGGAFKNYPSWSCTTSAATSPTTPPSTLKNWKREIKFLSSLLHVPLDGGKLLYMGLIEKQYWEENLGVTSN